MPYSLSEGNRPVINRQSKMLTKNMNLNPMKELVTIHPSVKNLKMTYWGCALAGEVGELCNLIKKEERDYVNNELAIKNEIADVLAYIAIIAKLRNFDLNELFIEKMKVVRERMKKVLDV